MNRREALAGMIGGGLGALAPAGAGAAHPVHRHLANAAAVDAARQASSAPEWSPAFLSTHQSDTLTAVAERMVPGSTEAGVNRFVDKLLTVDTQDAQRKFLEALSAFEAAALQRFGRPFLGLSASEQDAILEALEKASPSTPAEGDRAEAEPARHFGHLKGWISGAYYSSEIGMRELGWTGNTFFQAFPGCTHPGGHD
jgi:hypothetical protein